ncbi:hypothetical protein C2U70_12335, partial [Bradyrhizobium guangdongense]
MAFAVSACLSVPALAQNLSAQSAKIEELSRAGKYSEALPLAQAMVANLEKTDNARDLASALNNLAKVYADLGQDDQAE